VKQILTMGAMAVLLTFGCAAATRTPVILELFTSEGCSSCPPADQLLANLDRSQPLEGLELIVLSEHVDYWNRLGWSDPYSSPLFSARQQKYAAQLKVDDVYTPQVVVDGQWEAVGSNGPKLSKAIGKAASQVKSPLTLTATQADGKVQVHVQWSGMEKLHGRVAVYLALAQNEALSHVQAGENSGRDLKHVAVVRQLEEVGTLTEKTAFSKDATLSSNAKWTGGVRVIAFLQEKSSGRIIGAAQQKL
jgi:hypothetical protein